MLRLQHEDRFNFERLREMRRKELLKKKPYLIINFDSVVHNLRLQMRAEHSKIRKDFLKSFSVDYQEKYSNMLVSINYGLDFFDYNA